MAEQHAQDPQQMAGAEQKEDASDRPAAQDADARWDAQASGLRLQLFYRKAVEALGLSSASLPDGLHLAGVRRYFIQEVFGKHVPGDSVERILFEQIVLTHHRTAMLHRQAQLAKSWKEAESKNRAAAHLMAEIRQTALALKAYRKDQQSAPPKIEYHIGQQNISQAGGKQDIGYSKGDSTDDMRMWSRENRENVAGDRLAAPDEEEAASPRRDA